MNPGCQTVGSACLYACNSICRKVPSALQVKARLKIKRVFGNEPSKIIENCLCNDVSKRIGNVKIIVEIKKKNHLHYTYIPSVWHVYKNIAK